MVIPGGAMSPSSVMATPTVKRKRGRPPKPNSLSNKITTTLNINVNTSPLYSSPTAESNSRSTVKRGAPDIFTPLMRVSPTSRRKRSRKESFPGDGSGAGRLSKKRQSDDVLATPIGNSVVGAPAFSPYKSVNPKTLDNLTLAVRSSSEGQISMHHTSSANVYNTPPSSAVSMRNSIHDMNGTDDMALRSKLNVYTPSAHLNLNQVQTMVPPSQNCGSNLADARHNLNSLSFGSYDSVSSGQVSPRHVSPDHVSPDIAYPDLPKNLLPPASIAKKTLSQSSKEEKTDKNDFSLKLMVDDVGRAVLAGDMFSSGAATRPETKGTPSEHSACEGNEHAAHFEAASDQVRQLQQNLQSGQTRMSQSSYGQNDRESDVNDQSSHLESKNDFFGGNLHSESAIGIEARYFPDSDKLRYNSLDDQAFSFLNSSPRPIPLRRHHSDISGSSFANHNQNLSLSGLTSINESMGEVSAEKQIIPKTPRAKETQAYPTSSGVGAANLTPLGLNLTPNFNSMMYAMNSTSPQQKKNSNNFQVFSNQEFFMNISSPFSSNQPNTVNMNELVGGSRPTPNGNKQDSLPSKQVPGIASAPNGTEDLGDARLALKKIMHLKGK
ncbi:Piso0_005856 [Millerozyma farinosa CBS 7064]|uniref:Piso0_005856 protein n=1 Tax=Pichia sorbitophila (strain ATCC MYA-4447 / BCRC 22081 / CBS 7064 / NBRC 10061 / NRRL Y-12695) TaxID=559304 RepID=G8Y049_PICSO|nr:Piso0_005856 [Millerozyma farinosa CBS 7064]